MWTWEASNSYYGPKKPKLLGSFWQGIKFAAIERYCFLREITSLPTPPNSIMEDVGSWLADTDTTFVLSQKMRPITFEEVDWVQHVLVDNISFFQSGNTGSDYNTIAENQEVFSISKLMRHFRAAERNFSLPENSLGTEIIYLQRGDVMSLSWLWQQYYILNILNAFRTELAWGTHASWTLQSYVENSSVKVRFENRTKHAVQCELIVAPYETWHDGPQRLTLWPWPAPFDADEYSWSATNKVPFTPVAGKLMPLYQYTRWWWPYGSYYTQHMFA